MIIQKLEEAKRTVNAWVSIDDGQAGFEWQFNTLAKHGDLDTATELAVWWDAHPANPNPVR